MLTQRQYNKIMHDWIVLLTGLNGSNVRPQRNEFGFSLVDVNGQPIAFNSTICMFYFGFDGNNITQYYSNVDTNEVAKKGRLSITVVGEQADNYITQIQTLAMCETSRTYLRNNGFAIEGIPQEIINDKEYSSKWFYSRAIEVTFNTVLSFTQPNQNLNGVDIEDIPINL